MGACRWLIVPTTISRSAWRGEKRGPAADMNSMPQQAVTNGYRKKLYLRPQFTTASTVVVRKESCPCRRISWRSAIIREHTVSAMLLPVRLLGAWLVHLYTASSAVFGLWAVVACFRGQFHLANYLMMLTMVIDSTDGALARLVDVRGQIPWFDGRRLDDICDYFTYVLVPAVFLVAAGMLPSGYWAAVPVLTSAYGFSQDKAKTDDYFFLGWPSYWNVAVMYLWLLGSPPNVVLAWVLGLGAAIFVPLKYIYPSRTRVLRPLSLAVLAL